MSGSSIKKIFVLVFVLFGGFYDWTIALAGVIFAGCIVYQAASGKFRLSKREILNSRGILLWAMLLVHIVVSFYAVDCGAQVVGILRVMTVIMWFYVCGSMGHDSMEILPVIPGALGVMTIVSIVSLLIPSLSDYFWQAKRLGGIFQYSNTCALFLLLGIIICTHIIEKEAYKNKVVIRCELGVLILGLLLTGSRSVELLALLWAVYKAVSTKKLRKYMLAGLGGVLVIVGVMAVFGQSQNIGRLTTVFTSNSTMWGRLLYYSDALKMILRHPFGLGHMGYYYIQGSEQTGVYTTMYVHNDLLQTALDGGIIALILVVAFICIQFVKGRQGRLKKELLAVIVLASMTDFHGQYLITLMFVGLLVDMGLEGIEKRKAKAMPTILSFGCIGIVCFYFFMAFGFAAKGDLETSLALYKYNTPVQEQQLAVTKDKERAVSLAEDILEHNSYSVMANNNLAYAAAMDGNYRQAMEYKDKVIALDKYNVEQYVNYDALLDEMISGGVGSSDEEIMKALMERKESLRTQLADLEGETSPLAYKIKDKPIFTY